MLKFELTDPLKHLMQEAKVPGLSAAAVIDGALIPMVHGHATKPVPTNTPEGVKLIPAEPVTPKTPFGAASLSKPVFAYLVLKLIQANQSPKSEKIQVGQFNLGSYGLERFDLDTPLYQVLPELSTVPWAKALTPQLILSHQTGVPIFQGDGEPTFVFEPGTQFGYTGLPYIYLQVALERLTGLPLETLAQHHVFKPLKMTQSTFANPGVSNPKACMNPLFPVDPRPFGSISANSLKTTASDYARFVSAWIENETFAIAFRPEMTLTKDQWARDRGVSDGVLKQLHWGLGWGLLSDARTGKMRYAFHTGDMSNWRSMVVVDLKNKTIVVFFANSFKLHTSNGLMLADEILKQGQMENVEPILKYIAEKYSFATRYEANWEQCQQKRERETGKYLDGRRTAVPNLTEILSENLGFFKKLETQFLIENRHESDTLQHKYDERFGITIKK